ncbi:hypothetical protein B0O99DRAFT_615417 [Bisporella sp. PMI_857]|nr:hypothetical protein B0O99DRAFT_615417 [Bisporella sp. PMI_857]
MGRTRVTQRTELTKEQRAEIWGRYCGGELITSIAARFERSYSTISLFVNRRAQNPRTGFETLSRRPVTLKVSIREERALIRHATNHPKKTLSNRSLRQLKSNEVTFVVGEDETVVYVTKSLGEEYLNKNLQPTFKSERTTVGVWSCFCGSEMGFLVIIPKTCRQYFVLFYKRIKRKYSKNVVVQKDNASWHTAKLVQNMPRRLDACLENSGGATKY